MKASSRACSAAMVVGWWDWAASQFLRVCWKRSAFPQVVGWFLMYAGIALYGRSGAALVIAILFMAAFVPWILAEERALQARFGEAYTQYRKRTPRFLLM